MINGESITEFLDKIPLWSKYLLLPLGIYTASRLLNILIPGPQHQRKLELSNRTVLITGASSGLGRELAMHFYKAGARVILTARSVAKLEELCKELKALKNVENVNEPAYTYLDVCEPKDFNEILELSSNGKIDVLVNNAGLSMRGSCSQTSLKVHRQVIYFIQNDETMYAYRK